MSCIENSFELEQFCSELTDDWVLKELKVGEYAEESDIDNIVIELVGDTNAN